MVTIDDFVKLDIRTIKVLEATRMEGSEKLLKLSVDIGGETLQILSGIGKSYEPEDIVGKSLVAIVNLEPRIMMGEESQGMILATGEDLDNIVLLIPEKEVLPGSRIK